MFISNNTTSGAGVVSSDLLNSLNGTTKKSSTSTDAVSEDRFLTMLTTQLKNQDPMNPLDNSQMTSQLAQISTVDGLKKVNSTLESMLGTFQTNETMQAAAMVGRGVLVDGKGLQLYNGQALGGVELASAADKVKVSIVDSSGSEVANLDLGDLDAGSHVFTWDGKTSAGADAAAGNYTIKVSAVQGDKAVEATALQLGTVSSIVRGAKGVDIEVGRLGMFSMSDIKRILS
ncbi:MULTISPECIES: flagellar hook assembly protein FlgD [Niveibacterium]|uniref:Basal-body rod modification protein FlgD n=1 Tax=Niveibacterium microcysteis TaxID=2811415 RepID=A0ABX7MAK0_9RHOO|nr:MULTISPECIES: flagellar hook assembly protein FlgD [Niveibacterium]QSI78747.1 flagellar hook assembly protein FlgD [Niveibacterium microcysteis]